MAFALSATPTAGTGTVNITASTYTVTGVGTNFTGQALNGKIIILGGHNALVTAVTSATSLTINRAPAFEIKTSAFSFVNNGTIINQTGTDANPSGLGSIAGVTPIFDGANPLIRKYDIGSLPINIQGTLTIPDGYWLQATGGAASTTIEVASTGRLIIDGRYTLPRTDGTNPTTYSLACGIIIRKMSGVPYQTSTILFQNGSQFEQYGGIVETSGAIRWVSSTTSQSTIVQGTWYVYDRNNNGYMNIYFNLTKLNVNGLTIYSNGAAYPGILQTLDPGYSVKGFAVKGGLAGISAIDGQTALIRLDNFFGGESRFDFLVRNGGTVTTEIPVGGYDFHDANIGNALLAGTNSGVSQTTGRVRHYVTYTPKFLNSASAEGIVGGILYQKDSNSGSRVTNNGVPSDKIYINSSGSGGAFSDISLLTKVWSGLGVLNMNQDDRLPISGYFWDYSHVGTPVNVTSSIGPQVPTLYAPSDLNITLTKANATAKLASSFIINPATKTITVTQNSTFDDMYDVIKAFKCTSTQLNLETPTISSLILTPNGSQLNAFATWGVVINTGVELSSGVKFKKLVIDSVTISGTGKITGIYETLVGSSSRLILSNLVDTTIYIADNSGVQYQLAIDQTGTFTGYTSPGATGTWSWIAERYGYKRITGTFTPGVGGDFTVTLDWLTDGNLTISNEATVSAYTDLGTLDKLYDYFAYNRTQNPTHDIAVRDGTILDFGDTTIDVDATASSVWSYNSTTDKLTIKATVLSAGTNFSSIKTSNPITFLNGSKATCIYVDDEGSSTNVIFNNL